LEEARVRRSGVINVSNLGSAASPPFNATAGFVDQYAASRWPDVIANLRLDQVWGSAQVMGALHQVSGNYYGSTEGTGHPDDRTGFAVGGGLSLNLPILGKDDSFGMQVAYAEGATNYNGFGLVTTDIYDGNALGLGIVSDTVFAAGSALELTKSWSVLAGAEHHWTPYLRTSLYSAYAKVDYGSAATGFLDNFFGLPAGSNPDFSFWQVGSRTVWSPVKNFDLSLDVIYNHFETGFDGAGLKLPVPPTTSVGGSKPNAVYNVTNQDTLMGIVRVQRNFYP
jgi:Porin subfamily